MAGADGVVGIASDRRGFGFLCGKVARGEGNEAVGFVFDVVFEVEVVLLGSESAG